MKSSKLGKMRTSFKTLQKKVPKVHRLSREENKTKQYLKSARDFLRNFKRFEDIDDLTAPELVTYLQIDESSILRMKPLIRKLLDDRKQQLELLGDISE